MVITTVCDILPYVAAEINTNGWLSLYQARRRNRFDLATANVLFQKFANKQTPEKIPGESEYHESKKAIHWVKSLLTSEENLDNYKKALIQTVVHDDIETLAKAGIAASIIVAYRRAHQIPIRLLYVYENNEKVTTSPQIIKPASNSHSVLKLNSDSVE